jgi:primase-polymerase (primpol)-like protein
MRFFNLNAEIPEILTSQNNWLVWKKGKTDTRGKFSKYPVNPINPNIKINYQDPRYLMSYEGARKLYKQNTEISGLGFKLNGKAIKNNQYQYLEYLVGIDIDMDEGRDKDFFDRIQNELDNTYSEISPSGKGIRLFGLAYELIENWSHNHIEVYAKDRFLTITGRNAKNELKNITTLLKVFKKKYGPQYKPSYSKKIQQFKFPTPNEIANIEALLYSIDADCAGDKYRNIVFSILSLGWGEIGINLLKNWSQTAMHRWSEEYFDDLVSRYDQSRTGENNCPITIATVMHYASVNQDTKVAAWNSI